MTIAVQVTRDRRHGRHAIAARETAQIGPMAARAFVDLMQAQARAATVATKERQVVPRIGAQQCEIGAWRQGAERLRLQLLQRTARNHAVAGHGQPHILIGQQVMRRHFAFGPFHNLCAASVAIGCLELAQLILNEGQHLALRGQQGFQLGNEPQQVLIFLFQFLPFELRQAFERHVEDGLRLDFAQLEALHQIGARSLRRARTANNLNHFIQIFERNQQSFHDVRSRPRPRQIELGATPNDFAAMFDVMDQDFFERQQPRLAVHQSQQGDGEGLLHGGQPEKLVENLLCVHRPRKFDGDAHARAVGLIAQIADAIQAAFTHQLGDPLQQPRLVGHVG